ncbi:MAG: histidine kinase [Campylobacterales bacterium]|nr:histidine kinase [Campylobacterales bacterium]
MKHIELSIKKQDWLKIIIIGVFISTLMSIFSYFLVGSNLYDGFLFGFILGLNITLSSKLAITVLNNKILPNVNKKYWLILAMIFSFLSGFCATFISFFISEYFNILLIEKIKHHITIFAIFIGTFTYFIGALIYEIVKIKNIKEENETRLLQSRLKSLETQLNPHFLFNSLNSLVELIHVDTNKSEDMILKLSKFLRSSMEEVSIFSIKEEIENVKRYIELENIRFNNKINLKIENSEPFLNEKIPKFSIQLIVENGIKHGFKHQDNFQIDISFEYNKQILIRVKNSGLPICDEKFKIGLQNLKERVNILFNGDVLIEDKNNPTYLIIIRKCHEDISSR